MSVPIFKELDKTATDLLTKGFPTEHGFEIEGGSAEDLKFKVTSTHTSAALNSAFELNKALCHGVSLKSVAKAEKNVPVYIFEAAIEPKKVPGLKAVLSSECKLPYSGEEHTEKLALTYKHGERATIEESVAYASSGTVTLATTLALAHQAFRVGAHALATINIKAEDKTPALAGYGFKAGWVPSKTLQLVAAYDQGEKGTTAGATVYYKKDSTEAAGQVTVNPAAPTALPGFVVALSHAYDAKTTIKVKAASANNSFNFSLKHQLTDALAVTLGSECSGCCAAKAEEAKPAATHKYGISANLKL